MGKYKVRLLTALFLLFLGAELSVLERKGALPKFKEPASFQSAPEVREKIIADKNKENYSYEKIDTRLKKEGIKLLPVRDNWILNVIFPESEIWQFVKNGSVFYLVDEDSKIEYSAVNNQIITDKIVNLSTGWSDIDRDGTSELIAFVILHFKDVALCCNQRRFIYVLDRDSSEQWKVSQEEELTVSYGGEHKSKLRAFPIKDLQVIESIVEGRYINGLVSTEISWFTFKGDTIKKIWEERLSYNTDAVGTYPSEAMNNYESKFELDYQTQQEYPEIKVIKTYSKKRNKKLTRQEKEIIYYVWDEIDAIFAPKATQ